MSKTDWIAEQALRKKINKFISGTSDEIKERIISCDAESSYDYARSKNRRWEPGERVISEDPHYSCQYAIWIVKGRFELGEDKISEDAGCSLEYAREIVGGRWDKGEAAISKEAECSYEYALDIVEGRWEQGEEAISSSPMFMYLYAKDVIGGRLPDPLHNKMVMLNYSDDADEWVKKYCKAKKYMVRRRKKKVS